MKNPIVHRAVIGCLRSWWAPALQVIPAIVLSTLILARWPSDAQVSIDGSQIPAQSRQVFQLFGYGSLILVMLLVPIFPATTLVRERKQGTLSLLLNSPMTSWSIFGGKLLG